MSQQTKEPDFVTEFINRLRHLDPGERARLKRNAGSALDDSHSALGLFYKTLLRDANLPEWVEDRYFLVATLFPFDKSRDDSGESPGNLGVSLRGVRTEKNKEGLDNRFERLLDADEQQLPFYLRREIQFITNAGGRIDWEQLLRDILGWQHPSRYVQRNWARAYFATPVQSSETINQNS